MPVHAFEEREAVADARPGLVKRAEGDFFKGAVDLVCAHGRVRHGRREPERHAAAIVMLHQALKVAATERLAGGSGRAEKVLDETAAAVAAAFTVAIRSSDPRPISSESSEI